MSNMNLEKIFKGLILSEVSIWVFYIILAIFFPTPEIPQELQLQYVQQMEDVFLPLLLLIGCCVLPLYVWSIWKLYHFQNCGRKFYMIITLCCTPLTILSGNSIHTPLDIIDDIGTLISGFMIALMYFSPLKEKFTEKRKIL